MDENSIVLYHRIMRRENFETAAKDLFQMLLSAQKMNPDKPRKLYVDIDGHRNEEGGFDSDMLELQKEFGLGFLLQFFTEVHFPLISVKNTKEQCNDIPDGLEIFNAKNEKDNSLNDLFIENYSNTEFMSEEDAYEYLQEVSEFLKAYNDLNFEYALLEREEYDTFGWLQMWRLHMKDLINELFTGFIFGNLISAAAMTRSLIECCVYLSILKKEKNAELLEDWYLCSTISGLKKYDEVNQNKMLETVAQYCEVRGIDYEEVYQRFSKGNENGWLTRVVPKKRISFRDACEYLREPEIYSDFQHTSSFVHGQDITSKVQPFTFYVSIYHKFYIMMSYIFKSIRLYPIDDEMEEEIMYLEEKLLKLGEIYSR